MSLAECRKVLLCVANLVDFPESTTLCRRDYITRHCGSLHHYTPTGVLFRPLSEFSGWEDSRSSAEMNVGPRTGSVI
jgi:hypothetical protein